MNRRVFLKTGAASLALSRISRAAIQTSETTAWHGPVIDVHAHWTGPTVVKLLQQRKTAPRYLTNSKGELILINSGEPTGRERPAPGTWLDLDQRLQMLDKANVTTQVLSWSVGSFDGVLTPEEAKPLWKAQNDDIAKAVKSYKGRFLGLATLSTADPRSAAQELHRAHNDLGLSGAILPIDAFVNLESARYLKPIFEEAQKNKSHLYVHRSNAASNVPHQSPEIGETNTFFGLPPSEEQTPGAGDDTASRLTLLQSTHIASSVITLTMTDFLDPYPDVTIQVPFLGGSIVYIAEQMQMNFKAAHKEAINQRLRRIYYDTGQFGRMPHNLAFATSVIGADRILFGSDFGPQGKVLPSILSVSSAALSDAEKQQIFSENAKRLFKLK